MSTSSEAPPLRVSVDLNLCQAYAQCCYAAPRHFRIEGREALVYDPAPSAEDGPAIERARISCPVQAIRVEAVRAEAVRAEAARGEVDRGEAVGAGAGSAGDRGDR